MAENLGKRLRAFASTIIILILLAGVIGFYYFKYVPDRRAEFNRNAFLELSQIQSALQNQTMGYRGAIQNIIQHNHLDTAALFPFNYNLDAHARFRKTDEVGSIRFEMYDSNRRWRMLFPVTNHNKLVYPLSISLYPTMTNLVATYRDVFDSYLLIRDVQKDDTIPFRDPDGNKLSAFPGFVLTTSEGEKHKGKIMYHSPDLNTDFLLNPDSLLKKNETTSLLNICDVTIEGNSVKLFLYPFEIGNQKLTLAGLISDTNYRKANLKIPFNFFTLFTVLLLLLVIHLPILRIYILGANERIRDIDIRLIIGSYFIAGFFGFFLFTKIFLDKEQIVQNKEHLEMLSHQITDSLNKELKNIYLQLNDFDHTLDSLCKNANTALIKDDIAVLKKDTTLLRAMTIPTKDVVAVRKLDSLFKPRIYTHPDNIFWIGDTGKWVARWGYKKSLANSSLLTVKDRQYFKDFKNREPLLDIPGIEDSITLQPTLSKLEGEYVITVVKRSSVDPFPEKRIKDTTFRIKPYLIGLSSKIPAVFDVIMPTGYAFSIIDEAGMIQFDGKPGRALLTNIFKEIKDPAGVRQSVLYRNERYFERLTIRGRNMAVLSKPIKGMPYQLLVYFNHSRSDEFEEHLVALSAGLIGAVIALLIFSTLVNQWSKTKTRILKSHSHHFEWLFPSSDPLKVKYYHHLIRWMLLLFGTYLTAWLVIEAFAPGSEFSLLFISLLFPFYIALHYYELRERYYDVQEHREGIVWYFSRPSLLLRGLLLIIILMLNCFTVIYKYDNNLAFPVFISQIIWIVMIARSAFQFRHYLNLARNSQTAVDLEIADTNVKTQQQCKIPRSYIWAILTGVILISIIPASAIFWLFFRNEKGLYGNADQLTMGRQIDQRRQKANLRITDYKFNPSDPADSSGLNSLKFSEGIYTLSGRAFANDSGAQSKILQYPKTEYVHLHRMVFPGDSLALAWISPSDSAGDGTWYFANDTLNRSGPELVYRNHKDENNPNSFRLTSDSSASWNVAGLMAHSFSCTGTAFPIFFILGLCFSLTIAYFLTVSLSRRIFLVELHQITLLNKKSSSLADKYFGQSGIRPEMHLQIFNSCKQLDIHTLNPLQQKIPFTDPWFPGLRDIYYFEKKLPIRELENKMPWLIEKLEPIYCTLWKLLTPGQKFVLFDFSQDGFANYKASRDLQSLIAKGLLFFDDLRLSPMTLSFQEYVLQMKEDPDLNTFMAKTEKEDTWKKLKNPFLIILTAVGIFIFVTQEEVYQKITGLLATLTSLLPLLSNMFKPANKGDAG